MPQSPILSLEEQRALGCFAGLMIPPSAKYGVPGADDPAILADIVSTLGRDADAVREALRRLDALAGGPFVDVPADRQQSVMRTFHEEPGAPRAVIARVILQGYYRDDRVMHALGMEPRPPFPKGHVVEQGDWSLLDPVRARPKLWRDT